MGTPNLDLTLIQQSQANKEITANTALTVLDTFAGISTVAIAAGANNLTEAQCQAGLLVLTGTLTGNASVVLPSTLAKRTDVLNLCTGGYVVTASNYGGTALPCAYNAITHVFPGAAIGAGFGQAVQASSVAVTSTAQALTPAQAASQVIEFTGTLTGNTVITVPAAVAQWTIANGTTGAYTLTVKASGGTGVTVATGAAAVLYCDGTNVHYSVTAAASGVSSITDSTSATGAVTFTGSGVSQSGSTFTFSGGGMTESYVQWAYPSPGSTYTFSSPTWPMTLAIMSSNSTGTLNVQLPTQPTAGSVLRIKNASAGSTVTIIPPGSGQVIDNSTSNLVLTGTHSCVVLLAGQTTGSPGWNIISQY